MLDRYTKTFFWIFVLLGMLWGWKERALIDYYLSDVPQALIPFLEQPSKLPSWSHTPGDFGEFLGFLVLGIFVIIIGIFAMFFWIAGMIMLIPVAVVGLVLYVLKLHYVPIGAIVVYPFYVVFLNLFELFLLLMIRHPVMADIRYLTYRRDFSGSIGISIAAKLMIPIQTGAPALASHILGRQVDKAKKLVEVEWGIIRRLREEKLREARRAMESEIE